LCVFRSDLFKEAKVPAPATWQEVEKAALYFHEHPPAGFQDRCLPPLPEDADALEREFFAVAAPLARRAAREDDRLRTSNVELFSFHYDLETGRPRIAEPGFVEALALLQRLQAHRKPGAGASPQEAFRTGQAVFCFANASWVARFQDEKSAVRDKFEICRMPGSSGYYDYRSGELRESAKNNQLPYLGTGGWLGVVPKTAAHADPAFALLAQLSGADTGREIVSKPKWGGGPIREDQLSTPEIWNSFGLNPEQRNRLVEELRQTVSFPGLKNPAFRLRTPDEREHQRVLIAAVRSSLLDGKDPATALKDAARQWEELDQRVPLEERLTAYRRSLGLK
jgi:ABC-type glycerol-3-phosphate transport system substrate-binding protein